MTNTPLPVAILGATGSVGQRFVQLLDGHPWFRVVALTGSQRTAGNLYGETCSWVLDTPMPDWAASMPVLSDLSEDLPVKLVFSALPASEARDIEAAYAQRGLWVFSNASTYRREPDVPILMPEVNLSHVEILTLQRAWRGWTGGIVTNPNCTSAGLTVVLKALDDAFGVRQAFVVSMQALSGAGYPGVPSLDILDNVIPNIAGEEEKVEWEPRKMLGHFDGTKIQLADIVISAHTNRVAVRDGHTLCLSVKLGKRTIPQEVRQVLMEYAPPEGARGLPSTPSPVIQVMASPDRPQPRRDRTIGRGMSTVVGNVRTDPILDVKMTVLSHNTIRGAAGGSIYNAEALLKLGYIRGTSLP